MTCGYLFDIMYLLTSGYMMETDEIVYMMIKCIMPA